MSLYNKYIFIRDDDVYKYDKKFLNIFNFLKEHKIPVIYGVIPKLIEKKLVYFLNNEKSKTPHLLDIVQHGFSHKNYSKNKIDKYEFGITRSYSQQKRNIQEGILKMKRLFHKNFTFAFIPPYHGYDSNTLKIIEEVNIPIFSAGKDDKIKNRKFLYLPAEISLNDYDREGRPLVIKAEIMIRRLWTYLIIRKDNILGIVFHHESIVNNKDLEEFKKFFLFLKKLNKEKIINCFLFSQILEKNIKIL